MLGICNGFQILCESGLLPGVLHAQCLAEVHLQGRLVEVESTDTLFTRRYAKGEIAQMICAHGDGNYFADAETLDRARRRRPRRLPLLRQARRVTPKPTPTARSATSPASATAPGRILGMMPHPENAAEPLLGSTDGRKMFESALAAVAAEPTAPHED